MFSKKGYQVKCKNYWVIIIISLTGRLHGKVVKNNIEEYVKGKIGKYQAGFTDINKQDK